MNVIEKASKIIKNSKYLLIGAGAGMGKDSGMPDFRGPEGFWNNYPPYRNKFNFVDCANPSFLQSHPNLFWGFYGSRLKMYRQTKPHEGFRILKQFSSQMNASFVITSNVDGHFQKHFPENEIYEVHGSINYLQCFNCSSISANEFQPQVNYEKMSSENLPFCPSCNQIMRPNILMFNDWYWDDQRASVQRSEYNNFNRQIKDKLVIIEIGCGTAVPTIRNMCERAYYQYKSSTLIRINPDEDYSQKWMETSRYMHIKMGALEALSEVKKTMEN